MAVYQAPEGYHFDPQSGLYLKKLIVTDTDGIEYDHRIYFNDETGEYTQESFSLALVSEKCDSVSKKLKVAILALAAVIVVAFIVSILKGQKYNEISYTEEELDEIERIYEFDSTPDSTLYFSDYYGVVNEEGIIR